MSPRPDSGPIQPCNPQTATHQGLTPSRFRLFPVRSPLLGESRLISFPPGTEMFHFPGFAPSRLWIQRVVSWVCHEGFPHSGIPGSMPASGSPRLIAAGHALHRLLMPGHPPYALRSLTKSLPLITEALLVRVKKRNVRRIQLSKNETHRSAGAQTTTSKASCNLGAATRACVALSKLGMELSGIEPPTPCLQSRCSPN